MSTRREKEPLIMKRGVDPDVVSVVEGSVQEGAEHDQFLGLHYTPRKLPQGTSSVLGATFIIVNASLGAGLLVFPFAFYSAGGVLPSLAVMAFIVLFVVVGLLLLAHMAEREQVATYEEVVSATCGPAMKIAVDISVITYGFGANTAFLVVIGDQLEDFSAAFTVNGHKLSVLWWMDRRLLISLSALLLILPWLWMRRIGVLSYTSFLGVLCCVYIALVVTVLYFLTPTPDHLPQLCSRQWPDFFNAIPFICFGYQCHVSSVPVYAGLKQRNMKTYGVVLGLAMVLCVCVYTLTGVFGYLTFTDSTCSSSDVLRNYKPRNIPINIARIMLIIVMVTSYPILAFCGRTALDSHVQRLLWLAFPRSAARLCSWHHLRLAVEGTTWLLLSLLLALFVPQISYVINPIGGLAALLMFVFPTMAWLHSTLNWKRLRCAQLSAVLIPSIVLLVLGTFIFGNSVVYNIMNDFGLL